MRTLEEIVYDDYENLTYGELYEYELGCEHCPLYNEYCCGGMTSNGAGTPIEPPCCNFEDDTMLSDILKKMEEFEKRQYEHEKRQQIKENEIQEKKQKLKEKRDAYNYRNYTDIKKIKALNEQISAMKNKIKQYDKLKIYVDAVNTTNKMFRECNCNCPSDIILKNDKLSTLEKEILEIQSEIKNIKENIKQKEKKWRKNNGE